eukprot:1041939-Ditylum_brightwellii.AAC.1
MEALMAASTLPAKYRPILQASTPTAATNFPLFDPPPSAAIQTNLLNLLSPHEDTPPPPPTAVPIPTTQPSLPQGILPPAPHTSGLEALLTL